MQGYGAAPQTVEDQQQVM